MPGTNDFGTGCIAMRVRVVEQDLITRIETRKRWDYLMLGSQTMLRDYDGSTRTRVVIVPQQPSYTLAVTAGLLWTQLQVWRISALGQDDRT